MSYVISGEKSHHSISLVEQQKCSPFIPLHSDNNSDVSHHSQPIFGRV